MDCRVTHGVDDFISDCHLVIRLQGAVASKNGKLNHLLEQFCAKVLLEAG